MATIPTIKLWRLDGSDFLVCNVEDAARFEGEGWQRERPDSATADEPPPEQPKRKRRGTSRTGAEPTLDLSGGEERDDEPPPAPVIDPDELAGGMTPRKG